MKSSDGMSLIQKLGIELPDTYKAVVSTNIILPAIASIDFDFIPILEDERMSKYTALMESHFGFASYRKLIGGEIDSEYEILKGDKFYPFACTEQGDYISLYYKSSDTIPSVVYIPYDEDGMRLEADTFDQFLYFRVLKMLNTDFLCMDDHFDQAMSIILDELKKVTNNTWVTEIKDILISGKKNDVFISDETLKELVEKIDTNNQLNKDVYHYDYNT